MPRGGLKRPGGLRTPPEGAGQGGYLGGGGGGLSKREGGQGTGGDRLGAVGTGGRAKEYRVVAGLTLYKVQTNIYLLDFHKREGDQFTFMVSLLLSTHS